MSTAMEVDCQGVDNPTFSSGNGATKYRPVSPTNIELSEYEMNQRSCTSRDIDGYPLPRRTTTPGGHSPQPKEVSGFFEKVSSDTKRIYSRNRKKIMRLFKICAVCGWIIYLAFACTRNLHDAVPLLVITGICVLFTAWTVLKTCCMSQLPQQRSCLLQWTTDNQRKISILLFLLGITIIAVGLTFSFLNDAKYGVSGEQFISLGGYVVFPAILYVFSAHRTKISWRPVIGGFLLQFCMGLFVLRTKIGFNLFDAIGQFVQLFLGFIEAGSTFIFGATFNEHGFAFKTMPIIIYFSSVVSALYYLGAMQWLIKKVGWLMFTLLGTSATESMVAAGNIFIGQTESPLLIRPFLPDCTNSEILAIMAAGMGTIAGSVLGAYLDYGADAVYLITGSVMAAPCVLAMAKLFYPETKKSKFVNFEDMDMENQASVSNIIEALMKGAIEALPLVGNIVAILLAILAIMAALDAFLLYLGALINIEDLTLDLLFSYLFFPITFMLGIEKADLGMASSLIGKKVILNEFIAYGTMSETLGYRDAGCVRTDWLSYRSEAIVTYALCGFANLSSMGIVLGGLSEMAPKRQGDMARLILRALIVGCFVSFQNAAMSGFLLNNDAILATKGDTFYGKYNTTLVNGTADCTEVGYMYLRNGCSLNKATVCGKVNGTSSCCDMESGILAECERRPGWFVTPNCTVSAIYNDKLIL